MNAISSNSLPSGNSGRNLRLGIIGLGLAGGAMVPVAHRHSRVELVAAADPNPELRERFAEQMRLPAYADDKSLLDDADIDAVYIATPHQFHAPQTLLAAQCGKHIIVEKPMALSPADCREMIAAANANGVQLIVGHTHSFDPAVHRMPELADELGLGGVAMISMMTYTDFLYRPRRPEELDTARGGGILFNQVPHQVDIACLLAKSRVRSVRAWAGVLDPTRPTEGASNVFLDFESGAAASLVYSGYDGFDTDEFFDWVNATGRRKKPAHGSAKRGLRGLASPQAERELKASKYGFGGGHVTGEIAFQPHFGTLVATYPKGDLRPVPDGVMAYTEEGARSFPLPAGRTGKDLVLDEFCDAVLDGAEPTHHGEFATHTLEVCLAIQQSARDRKEVEL